MKERAPLWRVLRTKYATTALSYRKYKKNLLYCRVPTTGVLDSKAWKSLTDRLIWFRLSQELKRPSKKYSLSALELFCYFPRNRHLSFPENIGDFFSKPLKTGLNWRTYLFLRALELEYRNWTTAFSSSAGSLRWRLPATCNIIECYPSCPSTVTGFLRFLLWFGCRFNSTETNTYSSYFLHLQVYLEVMIPSPQLSVHWLRRGPLHGKEK